MKKMFFPTKKKKKAQGNLRKIDNFGYQSTWCWSLPIGYITGCVHMRKQCLKYSFSEAKQEIPLRSRFVRISPAPTRNLSRLLETWWFCAGGWNVIMVREKHRKWPTVEFHMDWRRNGRASGMDQKEVFEKTKQALSWWTPVPDQERQPAATLGNEDPASLRPIPRHPWSRCSELQREDKILTGIQAQKKGCQISVLLEVEGVGLWLLFGQAVGAQSGGADTQKEI